MSRTSRGISPDNLGTTAVGPLAGSAGPFTFAFWVKPATLAQSNTYLTQSFSFDVNNKQIACIFGFVANQVEFYSNGFTGTDPRTSSGLTLPDLNWHHVCYRKAASGASAWDKFLDGVKTSINSSISFTLPALATTTWFTLFAANNWSGGVNVPAAWFAGSLAEVMSDKTAWTDAQIARLSRGTPARRIGPRPEFLWELRGTASPEPERASSFASLAIGGGVTAGDSAPVRYQTPARVSVLVAASAV